MANAPAPTQTVTPTYTPAQVASINAAREANVQAGVSAYSGAGATAGSIANGNTAPGTGTPLYAAPSTINSANTKAAPSIQLPPPPTPSNAGTQAMTNIAGQTAAVPPPTPTTPAATTDQATTDFQTYLKGLQAPTNTADLYATDRANAGIDNLQQNVNTYQAQLNAITAKASADKLSLVGQGNGVPNVIIGGQQAEIDREAAIQSLPVAAQLAAAQSNLTLAQDNVDTLFKLQSADAQAQNSYQNSLVTAVYNFATSEQKTQLDALTKANDQKFTTQQNNLNYAQSLSSAAIQNGQPGIAAQLMKLDPNAPDYAQQIATLAGGIQVAQKTTGGLTFDEQNTINDKNQANDVAQAVQDFQSRMQSQNEKGVNPEAYSNYKAQLVNKYGYSAATALDTAMSVASNPLDNTKGINVDYPAPVTPPNFFQKLFGTK